MSDLKNKKLIWIKGGLFLFAGLLLGPAAV